ncbi:MAG: hypothetical protein AB7F09_10765 [Parvibaculaceae bacterium]
MKSILTTTALASAFILGTLVSVPLAKAQDEQPMTKECMGENCPSGATQGGEQTAPGKRMRAPKTDDQMQDDNRMQNQVEGKPDTQDMPRKKRAGNQQNKDVDVDVDVRSRVKVGEGKWRFDSSRHQRRRSKSATFRFYYGGYWYPQPYWEVVSVRPSYRISCGEGRSIVSERFNRVRVVECNGGTYTYLGRRQGDTYRVLLNARTGRIVGRTLI